MIQLLFFVSFKNFKIVHTIQTVITNTFKCEKDGFFPDKRDCWIYHICAGTTHSVKACKEDLLFNPIKNECDWAMNVNLFLINYCIDLVFFFIVQVNCSHISNADTLPATMPTRVLYPPG